MSIADIEGVEDLRERGRRYGERQFRAPQISREILAEADAHRAAVARTAASQLNPVAEEWEPPWRHYDSDEGWGRKHKHKRTHKNKKCRSRKGRRKKKKSRKH